MAKSTASSGMLKLHEKMLDTISCGTENEAIALFSEEGHDVNTRVDYTFDDRKKYVVTPLAWAVRHNRPLLCRYLLKNGANPYSNLVFDYYPLHEACNRGYESIVKIFIEMKCDINRVTSDRHSPLHIACMRGHIECARLLLDAGANRERQNSKGQTPLELGIYHGQYVDLYQLFSCYSIDPKLKIQRRHSLHSPTGSAGESQHPLLKDVIQGSVDSNTLFSCPQSLFIDLTTPDFTDSAKSGHNDDDSRLRTLMVPDRIRSHSNQNLASNSDPVSLGSFLALPRTCSSNLAPSTSQLHVTPPSATSVMSVSSSSRPHLIAQISQTSSDSPSPVERDGIWSSSSTSAKGKGDSNHAVGLSSMKSTASPRDLDLDKVERRASCGDRSKKSPEKLNRVRKAPLCNSKQYLGTSLHSSVPLRNKLPYHSSHSNPEFPLMTHMRVTSSDRTHSFDDLYSKKKLPPSQYPTDSKISPSRDKINSLTSQIYSSLDRSWVITLSSYTSDSYHMLKDPSAGGPESNPFCEVLQKIINVTAPLLNLDRAHIQTLMELSGCFNNQAMGHQEYGSMGFSSLSTTCATEEEQLYDSPVAYLLSLGYSLVEKPLTVTFGVSLDRYMALTFRLISDSPQTKDALLKVHVRVFDLKNKYQSSAYHYSVDEVPSSSMPDSSGSPQWAETNFLTQLSQSPHPNLPELISTFKAKTIEQHELFAQQLNPDNPKTMYTTSRVADFMVLQLPRLLLNDYCNAQKQSSNTVPPETMVLSVLSQLLLAVGHLINNKISHCSVSSCNIHIDEADRNTILLANFSHAVQLNSQKQNLERIRQTESRLKDDLSKSLCNRHCVLSPEVIEAVENSDLESAFLHGDLQSLFAKNDTYGTARTIYCWLLSKSHSFLNQDRVKPYGYDKIPYLSNFSPQFNHLLRKLIAYDHRERLSPMEGALACFVLIFGPATSDIKTEDQCYEWLLAETVEFYMRPVLVDSNNRDYMDCFSKLLCIYLTVASSNPRGVWNACRFFSQF